MIKNKKKKKQAKRRTQAIGNARSHQDGKS